MKKIILNCTTPLYVDFPCAALSVLKTYLKKREYNVEVIYWNLIFYDLQNEFLWNNIKVINDENILLLYYNYVAVSKKNKYLYQNVKSVLKSLNPNHLSNCHYYDDHMRLFAQKTEDMLENILSEYHPSDILYYGFTMKLDQWFVASIIADKIKTKRPNSIIVVGGINTKEAAVVYLENFNQFDFAMWGEGELPLLQLSEFIEHNRYDFFKIKHIAYRNESGIKCSTAHDNEYVDLSDSGLLPDYEDYFRWKKVLKLRLRKTFLTNGHSYLPIEGSRGCHWNKCNFCYLNSGYKYRLKSIEQIVAEIEYMIGKYNIYVFEFLDNDLVGKDIDRFNELLDAFIKIKTANPEFLIIVAEIITKDLDKDTIKKMALAGISNVQIGYESSSNTLLEKINKKNTFGSNLNFIKHAKNFKIGIGGVNVIINLPEEKNEDIIEAIDNLRFLRFYLNKTTFTHNISPLQINHTSKYFTQMKDTIPFWNPGTQLSYMSKYQLNDQGKLYLYNYMNRLMDYQWESFLKIEAYYLENPHRYYLLKKENSIVYQEYKGNKMLFSHKMDEGSIDLSILQKTNDKPISIVQLESLLLQDGIKSKELTDRLDFLYGAGLLYYSNNYNEIVSTIEIDRIDSSNNITKEY